MSSGIQDDGGGAGRGSPEQGGGKGKAATEKGSSGFLRRNSTIERKGGGAHMKRGGKREDAELYSTGEERME